MSNFFRRVCRHWWAFPLFHGAWLVFLSTGLRLFLWLAYRPEGAQANILLLIMARGLWMDLAVAAVMVLPLAWWCALRKKPWSGIARKVLLGGVGLAWFLQLFLFVCEGYFFDEFLSRFNTVAIDYLIYPTEVMTNLWESYPLIPIVLACGLAATAVTWLSLRMAPPIAKEVFGKSHRWGRALIWPAVAFALTGSLLVMNPNFSRERVVNELASNGAVSGATAAWSRNLSYEAFYATLPRPEAYALARHLLGENGGTFSAPPAPPLPAGGPDAAWFEAARASLQRHIAGDPNKPKYNVCILLEESLGSEFFGSLGRVTKRGKPDTLTPRMDELMTKQGLLFDNIYADGNRTIRGFEGVFSSFPPLPGDSILARDRTENVETIARVLQRDGYQSLFLYGGRGTFDFIRSYVTPNGWDRLIDQPDFVDPIFTTAWGVCDEDLYNRSIQEMRQLHATGVPFLVSMMTVSNHLPYTYPPGRIKEDPGAHSRKHVVKYSDWALGDFFEKVQKEPFWQDTIFVVVADHGARVYGSQTIPLKSYEIPFTVLGPCVVKEPRRIRTLGCQLDVTPTVLGLLGRPYDSLFFGRDLLADEAAPGRVLMHHNRSIGIYRKERMAVFGLNQQQGYWKGPLKGGSFTPLPDPDARAIEAAREGMALFRVADDLYLQRCYRVIIPAPN